MAIDLICTHIKRQLQERSNHFRSKMAIPHLYLPTRSQSPALERGLEHLNLTVHPQTPQVQVRGHIFERVEMLANNCSKGIYTILRSKNTPRQDFIFFVDRLATLLVEHALQHLPFAMQRVVTPVDCEFIGLKITAKVGN